MPKSGDLDSTFSKTNVRFEISTFEIVYIRNFVKTLDSYFLAQNIQIWAFELEVWKSKANRKLQISSILKFWVISGRSTIFFFGSFCLVLGRIGWFRLVLAGFGSFWLVPGFSKYNKKHNQAYFYESKVLNILFILSWFQHAVSFSCFMHFSCIILKTEKFF